MNLKPRIALFRGTGIISALIKIQTRSEYSHAALVIPGTINTVIEAKEFAGVQTRELTEHDMRSVDFYAVPEMTDQEYDLAMHAAHAEIGKRYDYWSVVRFLTKTPASENNRWFCSEFVHKMLADAGHRLLHRIPSAEVAPSWLSYSPKTKMVTPRDPR